MDAVAFLLDTAYAKLPEPAIVPLSDGGIQLEWHRNGIDLEVTFSDASSGVFLEDASGQVPDLDEAPISEAKAVLTSLILRLSD